MTNLLEYLENSYMRNPEKTAVSDGENSLSYSQLIRLSYGIGRKLGNIQAKDRPVCVMADRSVNTLAYFMGVLYSGNFYVPIDPEMPAEKMQMIIDDCRPAAVCGPVPETIRTGGAVIIDRPEEEECMEGRKISDTDSDKPAYMVYTSGSTGKPKGVLKSHASVMSFVAAYRETFDFSQDEIIGNQTPFFFDASAKDIYLSLSLGATMEIIPSTKFAMPADLIEYLNEKTISFISWVPTALSIVAQLRTFGYVKPKYLKKVFFVGEVMPVKHLNYWRKNLPDIMYVNLYGQTELAGICCYYVVTGDFADDETLPMGKPLSNCRLYLVDNGRIVEEAGRLGEIYIASDALANCYYNDKEKTEKAFPETDFGGGPVRCLKTGDIAFLDGEGNYKFASRSDFQIKHLGHRIELGEIEAVAGALPEIVRCACLYNNEKKSIVLFAETEETAEAKTIKGVLRKKLSSYMVPDKVMIIEKLPINANGKINRQKLKELL